MKPSGYTCKEAVVLDTNGEIARVMVKRGSACDHCEHAGSCTALSGGADLEVKRARNEAGASEGDRVELRMQGATLVKGALVMYFLPLLSMGLFIAVSHFLRPVFGWEFSHDVMVLLASAIGLVVSVPIIRVFGGLLKRAAGIMPTVARKL